MKCPWFGPPNARIILVGDKRPKTAHQNPERTLLLKSLCDLCDLSVATFARTFGRITLTQAKVSEVTLWASSRRIRLIFLNNKAAKAFGLSKLPRNDWQFQPIGNGLIPVARADIHHPTAKNFWKQAIAISQGDSSW